MDVFDAIRYRRSVRKYSPQEIPEDVYERMLEALRLAPSACNYQPWRFIVVRNESTREALARACHNQMFMAEAPVIVVGCGFPDKAYKKMGGSGNSVEIDLAIALDHLMLAAAAEELGTCWIGAFDEQAVKDLLGVPVEARVIGLTPLGYPATAGLLHYVEDNKRKSRDQILSFDSF